WVLMFYPVLAGISNMVMLCSLLCFVFLRSYASRTMFNQGIILAGAVWLLNAGFTICASSAALRFQSFPIILTVVFAILLIDWMFKLISLTSSKTSSSMLLKGDKHTHSSYIIKEG